MVRVGVNSHWKRFLIEAVYLGLYDGPHATPKAASEGPVFLGIKNITDDGKLDLSEIRHIAEDDFSEWTRRVLPHPGDIVFTYEATLNRYAIIPKDFRGCLGRRLALIRPNPEKIDTRFLFYYFFSEDWRSTISKNMLAGSTVDRIPLTHFPRFEISMPPLPTQRKIAAILSAYDDLIENNTRRIAILEEMAQSLYREWFVHFRFPGHEKNRMVNSELGMIPEGWEVVKLGDVVTILRGRSYASTNIATEDGLPFLNLKCIERDGGFRTNGIKRYLGPYKETQTAKAGDIVMAVTDMTQERRIVARAARVPATNWELFVFSMDLVKIVPKDDKQGEYFYSMLRFSNFPDEVKQHANGANVLHLAPELIENFMFPLAPKPLAMRFSAICADIYHNCDVLQSQNENLRHTRDLLLPKLILGEVDVEELEIETGEETSETVVANSGVERVEEAALAGEQGTLWE